MWEWSFYHPPEINKRELWDPIRPGKSCKRFKWRLWTFCRNSRSFEDLMSKKCRIFDQRWRQKSWRWIIEDGSRRMDVGWWRMEGLEFRNEVPGLWIEDKQSRFEDLTKLHPHLTKIFLVILSRESRYFEDILKLWIFRLRTFYNFFQVCNKFPFFCSVFNEYAIGILIY